MQSIPGNRKIPVASSIRTTQINLELCLLFHDPDSFLDAPNAWLNGARPRELIGTENEHQVIEVIVGMKQGIFS